MNYGRTYNFSAGPAMMPEPVLEEIRDEMMNYRGSGMCVMEMSHRSKVFEQIIQDALSRGVEGLFLPTYSLSAQVLSVMKKQGIQTPKDLALVCFDESDIFSLYATTVTHIVQPLKELGEKSVETLVRMIENGPAEKTVLKPTLVGGGSTNQR